MKLKELPASLIKMIKLWTKKPQALNRETDSDTNLIVSLTSIPSRLNLVHFTIRSVLNQSTPPKKVVLWLNSNSRNNIPYSLKKLEGKKFEIRYTELDSPHCKLIPSLLKYPTNSIVTCDDDLLYSYDWLSNLFNLHLKHPDFVVAYKVRQIKYTRNGQPKPYSEWPYEKTVTFCGRDHIALGYGGVLYPPGSLANDVSNPELFMKLCPKADDLWFKAMQTLNQTMILRVSHKVKIQPIPLTQFVSLKKSNVREDNNSRQWSNICNHYPSLNKSISPF